MRVAIAGLGLIGGSLAKTIKARTDCFVAGYDNSTSVVDHALSLNSINEYTDNFSGFDMVIICIYPRDTVDFLKEHITEFSPDCIVVDACGVKEFVCSAAVEIFKDSKAVFIGGHPMAGREFSGFDNSISTLFSGSSMILTPADDTPKWALGKTEDFFHQLGFGYVTMSTPQHHDQIIAYTSQLAHVVSNAYMQSPTAEGVMGFSAGSFADLTRVAKLNPEMWTELFMVNKKALVSELDTIINNLNQMKTYIENDQSQDLSAMLKKGSDTKERLNQEREKRQCE